MKKILVWIEKNEWMLVVVSVGILLRIPSLFEPHWYGDEEIYLTIGQAINSGLKLYQQIHDNKPPLLYLMAALSNGELFWFKFCLMIWNTLAIVTMYKLARKLGFVKKKAIASAGIFMALTSLPFLEGNIANAEIFFLLPAMLAVIILWGKNISLKHIFVGGLFLGIGALFKMPILLEAGVWPLYWLIFEPKRWWSKSLILAAGVLMPIGLSCVYYWWEGSLKAYLVAAWAQNLPYLSSWKASSSGDGIFSLKGRLVVLIALLAPILGLGKRLGKNLTFYLTWFVIGLFSALLSGRPYPHYLVQIIPVLSLLVPELWIGEKYGRKAAVLAIVLAVITFNAYGFYKYPVIQYYQNFLEWTWGKKDRHNYFEWFDRQVNANYGVASLVSQISFPGDRLFVWGDQPSIYALSRRLPATKYTVKYHIKDFKAEGYSISEIANSLPRVIVSYGDEDGLPGLQSVLLSRYMLVAKISNAAVFRLYNSVAHGKD